MQKQSLNPPTDVFGLKTCNMQMHFLFSSKIALLSSYSLFFNSVRAGLGGKGVRVIVTNAVVTAVLAVVVVVDLFVVLAVVFVTVILVVFGVDVVGWCC